MAITERLRRLHTRPLRDLSDAELDALDSLGRASHVLADRLRGPIDTLAELAAFELTEREFAPMADR